MPKALVPVLGTPFVDLQLALLADHGITDVVYCAGYRARQVRDFVGDGGRWALSVKYVVEDKELLGTAGALRLAVEQQKLAPEFFVMYGDSYLPFDFEPVQQAFGRSGLPALMAVLKNYDQWDRSNVVFQNGLVECYNKGVADRPAEMVFIDSGLSVMARELITKRVSEGQFSDLSELFHDLSGSRLLGGVEVHQRFYEVGSPQGLTELEDFLAGQRGSARTGPR